MATEHDAPPAGDPPAGDPPADPPEPGAGESGGSGGEPGGDDSVDALRREVREFMDLIRGDDGGGAGGDDAPGPMSAGDVEGAARRAVRDALDAQAKEKERDDRLAKVERAVERPPVKQGPISRFFWGEASP